MPPPSAHISLKLCQQSHFHSAPSGQFCPFWNSFDTATTSGWLKMLFGLICVPCCVSLWLRAKIFNLERKAYLLRIYHCNFFVIMSLILVNSWVFLCANFWFNFTFWRLVGGKRPMNGPQLAGCSYQDNARLSSHALGQVSYWNNVIQSFWKQNCGKKKKGSLQRAVPCNLVLTRAGESDF